MRSLLFALALLPLALSAAAPTPVGWGVVTASTAKAYGKDGKQAALVNGGELFDVLKEIKANGEPAFYVALQRPKKPECVLLGADCRVFLGEAANPKTDLDAFVAQVAKQATARDYYSAVAMRAKLLERARERHLAQSPAKDLAERKAQLAKVPAADRRYEAAQKAAKSNAERLRYQDLRKELRYRATGLQEEIKRLEAAAEAWEREHPFDAGAVQKGAVWKKLTQNIEALAPKARELGLAP